MKKLIAAGETRIFTFAPVFRNRERGALHAPEFTMLEWYRADAPYGRLWDDCAAILQIAAREAASVAWTHRGRSCDPTATFRAISVESAFAQYAGLVLTGTYTPRDVDRTALAARAAAAGLSVADDDGWSDIFSKVLTERIEPALGCGCPDILFEYPAHEAALARRVPGRGEVAERFELYCCGVELANGFGELTDPAEQRLRLEAQMAERQRIYAERYPIDDDFLAALAQMPPTSGCALGFDRLVMLATGAPRIDDVLWTPMA